MIRLKILKIIPISDEIFKEESVKIQEFTLVIRFVIFPQRCQFRLKNWTFFKVSLQLFEYETLKIIKLLGPAVFGTRLDPIINDTETDTHYNPAEYLFDDEDDVENPSYDDVTAEENHAENVWMYLSFKINQ